MSDKPNPKKATTAPAAAAEPEPQAKTKVPDTSIHYGGRQPEPTTRADSPEPQAGDSQV